MKTVPVTDNTIWVARRVIWFEEPEQALANPVRFLTYVMVYGTAEDLNALAGIVSKDDYRAALEQAPPGIFDSRSWAYWNLVSGRDPDLPLPTRFGLEPSNGPNLP